jgi:hypothetical protein
MQIAPTFSLELKKIVPAQCTALYLCGHDENDFNHHTGGERMPILASPATVGALIAKGENGFMLIKDRGLKLLAQTSRDWIAASQRKGSARWYPIECKRHS